MAYIYQHTLMNVLSHIDHLFDSVYGGFKKSNFSGTWRNRM